jgi:hypothetical protein
MIGGREEIERFKGLWREAELQLNTSRAENARLTAEIERLKGERDEALRERDRISDSAILSIRRAQAAETDRDTLEDANDSLRLRLLSIESSTIERAARAVAAARPGYTINVLSGRLDTDKDGPWGLAVDFAAVVRALSPSSEEGK